MATVIAVTGGKGGTGKTTVTAAVASCLAVMGKKTLCIDLDVGLRNLDLSLGLTDRAVMDFTDVAEGRCDLAHGAVSHPDVPLLHLLTAPMHLPATMTGECWRRMLHSARDAYDFIFLDVPAGLGPLFTLAVSDCDRALTVSTTDASSLRDGQQTVVTLMQNGVERIHLIVNRVEKKMLKKLRTTIDDAMDTTGLPLLGVIPEDDRVFLAANRGMLLITAEQKGAARAARNIALRLLGERVPVMRL